MYRFILTVAVSIVCQLALIGHAPTSSAAEAEDFTANYRSLEWHELVPEDWEPPLVPPAHDSAESANVPKDSVVAELDKSTIYMPGFMKPIVFEGNVVSDFLLVPFLPHHTKQHAHLDANQMIYVSVLEPIPVENPLAPIWVVGTLTIETVMTDQGPAAYRIADAVITDYEY